MRACRATSSITQAPSGSISPVSSATSMNSDGGTIPSSSSSQRASASTPSIAPVWRSTVGW